MRFCEVIVDLSAEAVDRRFTYSIPDGMTIAPGWQVVVPFGPRTLEGFVLAVRDFCDLPAEKVRPVLRTVNDYPVILPELLELSEWMHQRYLCNAVDTLRLMIPSQMRRERVRAKRKRVATLCISKQEAEHLMTVNQRAKAQNAIIARLIQGPVDTTEFSSSTALKVLQGKGILRIEEQEMRRTPTALQDNTRTENPELMPAQRRALDELTAALENGGGRFLLHGVTGSGKTEVYIRLIQRVLAQGKTAIVLVPEIALTPQMVAWFHARFGSEAAVLHSGLSSGERFDEWRRIRFGKARVVIGARSAVFAPLENIGVIVVDEEHESTYQSDSRPRYDAREIAWHRMERHGGVLLLGSATPSISSYMRAQPGVRKENRLSLIELTERVMHRPLPEVEVIDMRGEFEKGNHSIFSARLKSALTDCVQEGQQAILFINRRGYATFVSCRACGHVIRCSQCDVSMTYHQTENRLRCHYCGQEQEPPKTCPSCGSRYIKYFGAGTQRVQAEVERLLPGVPTVRLDVDTTQHKDAHAELLERFRRGEARIMIGTQMIAKGLDFPEVTLVGAVAADTTLKLPDYRSTERTFQLITQVAGRAGRADKSGRVIVQTYDPDHYAIRLAAQQDYRQFFLRESAYRKRALYPPFTVMARIVYTAGNAELAQQTAETAAVELGQWLDRSGGRRDTIQMRAMEAPIRLLRGSIRWQVFLKMYFKGDLQATLQEMQRLAENVPVGVRAELEVNPTNMF